MGGPRWEVERPLPRVLRGASILVAGRKARSRQAIREVSHGFVSSAENPLILWGELPVHEREDAKILSIEMRPKMIGELERGLGQGEAIGLQEGTE